MKKLFETFWRKIVLQLLITIALGFAYFLVRVISLRNKKINQATTRRIFQFILDISSNLPDEEDDFANSAKKSSAWLNSVENIRTSFGEKDEKKILETHAKKLNKKSPWEVVENKFIKELLSGLEKKLEVEIVERITRDNSLISIGIKDNSEFKIYTVMSNASSESENVDNIETLSLSDFVLVPKNTNYYAAIANELLKKFNNRLYISYSKDTEEIKVQELLFKEDKHYQRKEELFKDLKNEIDVFKSRNQQRSYLLLGPPGVGKTKFCIDFTMEHHNKIVKIDGAALQSITSDIFKTMIEAFDLEILIVDDIDHMNMDDEQQMLRIFEGLKTFKNCPTLLATANDIHNFHEAFLRPERIDGIFEFTLPNEEERFNFIEQLCVSQKIDLTEEVKKMLVDETDELSQSYIREFVELASFTEDMDKLVKNIRYRKELLE